jgi:hypothetical protein
MADKIRIATGTRENPGPYVELPSDALLCVVYRYDRSNDPLAYGYDLRNHDYDENTDPPVYETTHVESSFSGELHDLRAICQRATCGYDEPRFTATDMIPEINYFKQIARVKRKYIAPGYQVVVDMDGVTPWHYYHLLVNEYGRKHNHPKHPVVKFDQYYCIGVLELYYPVGSHMYKPYNPMKMYDIMDYEEVFAIVVRPYAETTTKPARR